MPASAACTSSARTSGDIIPPATATPTMQVSGGRRALARASSRLAKIGMSRRRPSSVSPAS
jgi:hypothetical protein